MNKKKLWDPPLSFLCPSGGAETTATTTSHSKISELSVRGENANVESNQMS